MPDPDKYAERMDEFFQPVRRDLHAMDTLCPQVERRIASLSVHRTPSVFGRSLAACVAILVLGVWLGWRFFHNSPRPPGEIAAADAAHDLTLEVDGAEFVQQIAAIVDQRFVVVIWSYRGPGVTAAPNIGTEIRTGKYRLQTLAQDRLSDGRTLVCSLFIPESGVRPVLEPPSIYAQLADYRTIAYIASPRAASRDELAKAIRSAGAGGKMEISVEEILRRTR